VPPEGKKRCIWRSLCTFDFWLDRSDPFINLRIKKGGEGKNPFHIGGETFDLNLGETHECFHQKKNMPWRREGEGVAHGEYEGGPNHDLSKPDSGVKQARLQTGVWRKKDPCTRAKRGGTGSWKVEQQVRFA